MNRPVLFPIRQANRAANGFRAICTSCASAARLGAGGTSERGRWQRGLAMWRQCGCERSQFAPRFWNAFLSWNLCTRTCKPSDFFWQKMFGHICCLLSFWFVETCWNHRCLEPRKPTIQKYDDLGQKGCEKKGGIMNIFFFCGGGNQT